MHFSIKTDYEGAQSNYSLHKFANIMLDKSKRKHEDVYRTNAKNLNSSRINANDKSGDYLTGRVYKMISNELSLLKSCRVMQYEKDTFLVYTPDGKAVEKIVYHQDF